MNYSPENPYGKGLDNPLVQKYQNYGLPLLAVLETVLTKGKSPGTTAMGQQQIFSQAADKRAAYEQQLEAAKGNALQRQVSEAQLGEVKRKSESEKEKLAKLNAFKEQLKGVGTDEEKKDLTSKYLQEIDPEGWAEQYTKGLKTVEETKSKKLGLATDLRKEYSKESDDYVQMRNAYQRYQGILKRNKFIDNGASDMALVFTYMKTLDPRSTVREGEFAQASQAAGVPSAILAQYNKLVGGGILDTNARDQLKNAMKGQYQSEVDRQIDRRNQYETLAKDYDIDNPAIITKHLRIEPIIDEKPSLRSIVK